MLGHGRNRVAICGAGPVGAFTACCLARRGYQVTVYEKRKDIRCTELQPGRSISVDVSCRGWEALNMIGLGEHMAANGVRVVARMVHDRTGKKTRINYGNRYQHILVFRRHFLNQAIIEAAEKYPNVQFMFSHKLVSCDSNTGQIVVHNDQGGITRTQVDLIIGADGAFSAVRQHMMRNLARFDYQQVYIPHGYLELHIPPTAGGQFAMEAGCHHLWPRQEYMMIAQPNVDRSYTVVLVMPFSMHETIGTQEALLDLFRRDMPDVLRLIGENTLVTKFFSLELQPLISTKCYPYHIKDKAVILGDAAHAMLPFYGQGMNCGLEDCIVLCEMLDKHRDNLSLALPEYTATRHPDATAISELTLHDYIQMYSRLSSRWAMARRKLDNVLYSMFPRTWIPLYTMVSFTRMPYHQCVIRKQWQDKVMTEAVIMCAVICGFAILAVLCTR